MSATGVTLTHFILVALGGYRIQRLLTTDSWPPTKRLREWTAERFGPESGWHGFVICGWCAGSVLTAATVAATHILVVDLLSGVVHNRAAYVGLLALAASSVVGFLADRVEA